MNQKTCYYCGTKYPLDQDHCPLCGQTETEPEALDETPVELTQEEARPVVGSRLEKKRKKNRPAATKRQNTASTILCIVLAVAVIAGAFFILSAIGVFAPKEEADNSSLNLPVQDETPAVKEVLCTGVSLTPSELNFAEAGKSDAITVSIEPQGCTQEIVFESSDPQVATVNANGEVTSVAAGKTTITVTCGEYAKSIDVVCTFEDDVDAEPTDDDKPADQSKLKLSTEDFSMFAVGETAKLSVSGADGTDVEWSSSDTSVATVKDGKVTAVGSGTASITAKVGSETLKSIVRCKFTDAADTPATKPTSSNAETAGASISQEDVTLAENGESFKLSVSEGESRLPGVSWSTSDSSVATVNGDGTVTAVGAGTATVTGTVNGQSVTCIVRCSF